jgi:hypothetical protein
LLSAVIQQQAHLLSPTTRGAAGGRTSPEGRNSTVRAPERHRLVARPAHAHRHARPDIITKRHGCAIAEDFQNRPKLPTEAKGSPKFYAH